MLQSIDSCVKEVLAELPSECAYIDYKEIPYKKQRYHELIKDVISMLNSEEGIGREKYIIFGVTNYPHEKKGLYDAVPMPDDNEYQNLFDMIKPRPLIQTGTVSFEGKLFGFIFISKDNTGVIYEVDKTYIGDNKSNPGEKAGAYKGQAFFRHGSKNYIMMHEDRKRILSYIAQPIPKYELDPNQFDNVHILSRSGLSSIAIAAVLGGWNEKNSADISIIENLSGQTYTIWIQPIRQLYRKKYSFISYRNGTWLIGDRINIIQQEGSNFYDTHLENLKELVIKVLTSTDGEYSVALFHGLSEFLAILGNQLNIFPSCLQSNVASIVFNSICIIANSPNLENLSSNLNLLAEASPDAFLANIEGKLKQADNSIVQFVSDETSISRFKHGTELFNSLAILACNGEYFMRSCSILFSLAPYNLQALHTLTGILLPWFPQTSASYQKRLGIVSALILENENLGWQLLISLMPEKVTVGIPVERPQYLKYGKINEKISYKEYWDVSIGYLKYVLNLVKGSTERLTEIIQLLDKFPKQAYADIAKCLDENSAYIVDSQSKYIIWNALLDFTTKHRKYHDASWALPEDELKKIDIISDKYKPKDEMVYSVRLFRENQYDLEPNKDSWEASAKALQEIQVTVVKQLLEHSGYQQLLDFSHTVDRPNLIGRCLEELPESGEFEEDILDGLVSDDRVLVSIAKDFVFFRFRDSGYTWVDSIPFAKWSAIKKALLLAQLPFTKQTWDYAKQVLGKDENLYWEHSNIISFEVGSTEQNTYAASHLLMAGRMNEALEFIGALIFQKAPLYPQIAVEILDSIDDLTLETHQTDKYNISKIIDWLQSKNIDHRKMVMLEWKYSFILNYSDAFSAKTLYQELADNPKSFLHMISLAYRQKSNTKIEFDEQAQRIAQQSWKLLHNWKTVPGVEEDKPFNCAKFQTWVCEVKEQSTIADCYEIAMNILGHVLFYSPADPDGFFIHKCIAAILQERDSDNIRDGYRTEAINSRGVHWVDPSGKEEFNISEKYIKRAEIAEEATFYRFATTLRDISRFYKQEGLQNIEESQLI